MRAAIDRLKGNRPDTDPPILRRISIDVRLVRYLLVNDFSDQVPAGGNVVNRDGDDDNDDDDNDDGGDDEKDDNTNNDHGIQYPVATTMTRTGHTLSVTFCKAPHHSPHPQQITHVFFEELSVTASCNNSFKKANYTFSNKTS